ncbi:MAG: hypothetical protein QME45_08910 [Clostridiales bacterium]|nr:hypothetical protein [Clostridiales bacterium]
MKILEYIVTCIKDVLKSIMVGIIVTMIFGVISLIASLLIRKNILVVLYSVYIFFGSAIMAIAGISFLFPDTQRPFEHKEEWERYFKKINFGLVLLIAGVTVLVFGVIAYNGYYY